MEHHVFKGGIVMLSGSWGCIVGQRTQKKVRGWWHTLMQQVFFWYIRLSEGYFLTVYPVKEVADPKEVERRLRDN